MAAELKLQAALTDKWMDRGARADPEPSMPAAIVFYLFIMFVVFPTIVATARAAKLLCKRGPLGVLAAVGYICAALILHVPMWAVLLASMGLMLALDPYYTCRACGVNERCLAHRA